jgi:hypothetical protein
LVKDLILGISQLSCTQPLSFLPLTVVRLCDPSTPVPLVPAAKDPLGLRLGDAASDPKADALLLPCKGEAAGDTPELPPFTAIFRAQASLFLSSFAASAAALADFLAMDCSLFTSANLRASATLCISSAVITFSPEAPTMGEILARRGLLAGLLSSLLQAEESESLTRSADSNCEDLITSVPTPPAAPKAAVVLLLFPPAEPRALVLLLLLMRFFRETDCLRLPAPAADPPAAPLPPDADMPRLAVMNDCPRFQALAAAG